MKRLNKKRIITSVLLVLVAVFTILSFLPKGVSINSGGYLSFKLGSAVYAEPPPNWWEDENLEYGLWYEDVHNLWYVDKYQVSYMKIYSLGSTLRVMELSTYPRAYVDTDPHVYEVDTYFTVTENDFNSIYRGNEDEVHPRIDMVIGEEIFRDTLNYCFKEYETGCHYAGDPLPGSFPKWIESEDLPTPKWSDNQKTYLPSVFQAIKGELCTVVMYEAYYKEDIADLEWQQLPQEFFDEIVTAFQGEDPEIKINRIVHNKDRIIVRVLYDRIIQ